MAESVPAGWYPAAPNSTEQRYWDGSAWTDYFYPPRPGQAPLAGQEAQPVAVAPQPVIPAKSRPKRRRRTVAIIIASVAVVAVAVTAVFVGVAIHGTGTPPASTLVNGYQYLPAIHVTPTQKITLPAKYDFDAKVKSVNPHGTGGDTDLTDKVIGVYTNAQLTSDAQVFIFGFEGTVQISPDESNLTGFADTTTNEKDYGQGSGTGLVGVISHLNRPHTKKDYVSWGLFDTYYIVQHYSSTGAKLKHPTVTPVIPSGDKLATPRVSITPTKGDAGSITFHWKKVSGATQYAILAYSDSTGAQYPMNIVGVTDGTTTTWDSSAGSNKATYLGLTIALYQNVGLQTYGDDSADDEQSGYINQYATNPTLYGVMALRGAQNDSKLKKEYSAMGTVDSAVAAALPAINARNADQSAFPDGPVTSIDQLPLLFPYTALDGSTRQTRGILKPGFAVMQDGVWNLMMQGAGVDLGIVIELSPSVDPNAFIAAYNAKSLAAAPKTGLSSLPVLASTVESGGAGAVSHSAPDLGFPVFGNDAFTKYIAANMIAHKNAVDISAYATQDVAATVNEAETQNPYIFDLTGYGLSGDGNTLYLTYGIDAATTTKLQQSVQSKVKSVVASVVTSSMSATEKVTALNDWVTAHVTYNDAALAASNASIGGFGYPKGYESAWDPDGALLDGSAVCGGYAAAFDLLANDAGIRTIVVTGDVVAGGRHAWNKVDIAGDWKDVDTTWNDDESAPNQYLLINDDQFTGDATRSQDSVWMPVQVQSQFDTAK
jgi:hypothetical protein